MKKDSFVRLFSGKGIFFAKRILTCHKYSCSIIITLFSHQLRCRHFHIPIVRPFTKGAFSPIRRIMTAAPKARITAAK